MSFKKFYSPKKSIQFLSFIYLSFNFQKIYVRFIEYMPFNGNKFEKNKMVPYSEMLKIIQMRYPMVLKIKDPLNSTAKVCLTNFEF